MALSLSVSACRDKDQGGDWAGQTTAKAADQAPAPAAPAKEAPGAVATDSSPVRFVTYNVRNWLTMERSEGGDRAAAPKPEKEREAVTRALLTAKPDILGVAEIGNEDDVKDLQKRLADAGWPMPHAHLNRGVDPTRSLAILSKYPIGKTIPRDDLSYRLQGEEFKMQRGILDANIETPRGGFRFLGVHLKSKREVQEGNEEEMRRNEAHLLRRELDEILTEDPQARLVVYGDFNDTRNSPSIRAIQGSGRDANALTTLPLKDSRGEYWTHHWDFQDLYSRIDYVMLSAALKDSVDRKNSKILDTQEVTKASDHRPLLVLLK